MEEEEVGHRCGAVDRHWCGREVKTFGEVSRLEADADADEEEEEHEFVDEEEEEEHEFVDEVEYRIVVEVVYADEVVVEVVVEV